MALFYVAEFWVGIAFFIFLFVLFRLNVHRTLLGLLDQRRQRITSDLEEARRLREDAEKVLADYKRRQLEAEAEAQSILAQAKAEAELIAANAQAKAEEFVGRRTKIAEAKIAQAEAQALADVRAAAADAAAEAAETVLKQSVQGKAAEDLVLKAIKDVKTRLV